MQQVPETQTRWTETTQRRLQPLRRGLWRIARCSLLTRSFKQLGKLAQALPKALYHPLKWRRLLLLLVVADLLLMFKNLPHLGLGRNLPMQQSLLWNYLAQVVAVVAAGYGRLPIISQAVAVVAAVVALM